MECDRVVLLAASLISADQGYKVAFPCGEGLVCVHMRRFSEGSRSDYVAVVTNGLIQPGCGVPIPDQTDGNVLSRFCHGSEVPSPQRGERERLIQIIFSCVINTFPVIPLRYHRDQPDSRQICVPAVCPAPRWKGWKLPSGQTALAGPGRRRDTRRRGA